VTDLFDWRIALGDIGDNGIKGSHTATPEE
jgi:hypothetical protein